MVADREIIKVVLASDGDFKDPGERARLFKPFCDVNSAYRQRFLSEVSQVRSVFSASLQSNMPAVAKITLKKEAQAKSYRPSEILNEDTCPIIGVSRAGELYASVTGDGLARLAAKINTASSKVAVSHLSTLEEIVPYTAEDALPLWAIGKPHQGRKETVLRVKLFRHGRQTLDDRLDREFEAYAQGAGVNDLRQINYGRGVRMYRCAVPDAGAAEKLARFVGTQSVCTMPTLQLVKTAARSLGPMTADSFPAPDLLREYPVVGQFDSGTDPNNAGLQKWVVARKDWHPLSEQNNSHGTFVAGLIANGRHLNHGNPNFPQASAKIVDVVVFDKSGTMEEAALITLMEESLKLFPDVKVWNLSLALIGVPCEDIEISEFGAAIDDMQKRYGVLFVCAAGNVADTAYLRNWPLDPSYQGQDRLAPPGDTLRGLTVGGLAHKHHDGASCVMTDDASPFSLRGPAMGGIIKPEVSHYAGNCDIAGNCMQTGIVSLGVNHEIAEDIGVSFATPLITAVAGSVESELRIDDAAPSPTLVKALIVHSAFVKNGPARAETIEYKGLGRPMDVEDILHCTQSSATVVFQVPAERNPRFYKHPFAMPPCLAIDGLWKCDVFMTLAYDPPCERRFGIEYCRRNIVASLGFMEIDEETNAEKYTGREVHPSPNDLKQRYSEDLVEYGLDWSPLKFYYRRFSKTPAGKRWRLHLKLVNRAECVDESPIDASLIVTIKSHDPDAQVYTEMVREMDALGWTVRNLEIKSREREQH